MSTNFQRCLPHVLLTLLVAVEAHGAGLYFTERGVRPLSRGGAFVAGADDLGSIGYNPAGLAEAGSAVLFDFSWLNFTSQYTRQTQAVDSSGVLRTVDSPTVNGTTPFLPLPTLGESYAFGNKKQYVVALGAYVPYTPVASYPTTISGGAPSPSRYSLVSLDGSALAVLGGWFAFKPVEILSVGAGVEMLPTSTAIREQTVEKLAAHLEKMMDNLASKGIDKKLIAEQAMITPSCGTGSMDPADAEKVFETLFQLSKSMKAKYGF